MNETRPRGRHGSSAGRAAARAREQPLDDWLGDVSDEDWSEDAAERAERRRATPAYQELPAPAGDLWPEPADDGLAPTRPVDPAADARRAVVERRRLVAGLVLAVVLGLAVLAAVLLLRGGDQAPATSVTEPSTTTTAPTESTPSSTPTTTTPNPSTTTPATPSTPDTSTTTGFTLPEGTKLRLGEGDPAVVKELQQALTSAGYDPGSADGTYGPKTEAAVTAFQQANGLSADGVVGPETATALNSALAGG